MKGRNEKKKKRAKRYIILDFANPFIAYLSQSRSAPDDLSLATSIVDPRSFAPFTEHFHKNVHKKKKEGKWEIRLIRPMKRGVLFFSVEKIEIRFSQSREI